MIILCSQVNGLTYYFQNGATCQIRTDDRSLTRRVLYQLS